MTTTTTDEQEKNALSLGSCAYIYAGDSLSPYGKDTHAGLAWCVFTRRGITKNDARWTYYGCIVWNLNVIAKHSKTWLSVLDPEVFFSKISIWDLAFSNYNNGSHKMFEKVFLPILPLSLLCFSHEIILTPLQRIFRLYCQRTMRRFRLFSLPALGWLKHGCTIEERGRRVFRASLARSWSLVLLLLSLATKKHFMEERERERERESERNAPRKCLLYLALLNMLET